VGNPEERYHFPGMGLRCLLGMWGGGKESRVEVPVPRTAGTKGNAKLDGGGGGGGENGAGGDSIPYS